METGCHSQSAMPVLWFLCYIFRRMLAFRIALLTSAPRVLASHHWRLIFIFRHTKCKASVTTGRMCSTGGPWVDFEENLARHASASSDFWRTYPYRKNSTHVGCWACTIITTAISENVRISCASLKEPVRKPYNLKYTNHLWISYFTCKSPVLSINWTKRTS